MRPSDRYLNIVEWSEEDRCFVGVCPGLMLGGIHGDDEVKVYQELCQVVDEWKHIYEEDGDPLPPATAGKNYSGEFVLNVGEDLHKQLTAQAMHEGQSLNAYCVKMLRKSMETYGESPQKC